MCHLDLDVCGRMLMFAAVCRVFLCCLCPVTMWRLANQGHSSVLVCQGKHSPSTILCLCSSVWTWELCCHWHMGAHTHAHKHWRGFCQSGCKWGSVILKLFMECTSGSVGLVSVSNTEIRRISVGLKNNLYCVLWTKKENRVVCFKNVKCSVEYGENVTDPLTYIHSH